jgi:hypothetical protein
VEVIDENTELLPLVPLSPAPPPDPPVPPAPPAPTVTVNEDPGVTVKSPVLNPPAPPPPPRSDPPPAPPATTKYRTLVAMASKGRDFGNPFLMDELLKRDADIVNPND